MPPRGRNDPDTNDWHAYRMFVVESLKDIQGEIHQLASQVTNLRLKMAAWAAIWGFIGGIIPIAIEVFLRWKDGTGK